MQNMYRSSVYHQGLQMRKYRQHCINCLVKALKAIQFCPNQALKANQFGALKAIILRVRKSLRLFLPPQFQNWIIISDWIIISENLYILY